MPSDSFNDLSEQLRMLRAELRGSSDERYYDAYTNTLRDVYPEEETTDMPHNPTFGFEAEFEEGAEAMCTAMYSLGLTSTARMHSWHCDCEDCQFEVPGDYTDIPTEKTFRFQTDSSCSGECISRVYDDFTQARDNMNVLQEQADIVDAIPGWNAGFHVHVSVDGQTVERLSKALVAFVRWEPALEVLAAGRFERRRDNNNSVQQMLHGRLYDFACNQGIGFDSSSPDAVAQRVVPLLSEQDRQTLFSFHHRNDRHSNLSIRTRHNTWEFRLWNSTRVAWRMEMFCRLSRALLDPAFVESLLGYEFDLETRRAGVTPDWADHDIAAFTERLNVVDPTAAMLVERQHAYTRKYRGQYIPDLVLADA